MGMEILVKNENRCIHLEEGRSISSVDAIYDNGTQTHEEVLYIMNMVHIFLARASMARSSALAVNHARCYTSVTLL